MIISWKCENPEDNQVRIIFRPKAKLFSFERFVLVGDISLLGQAFVNEWKGHEFCFEGWGGAQNVGFAFTTPWGKRENTETWIRSTKKDSRGIWDKLVSLGFKGEY